MYSVTSTRLGQETVCFSVCTSHVGDHQDPRHVQGLPTANTGEGERKSGAQPQATT